MKRGAVLFGYFAVHKGSILLGDMLGDRQNLDLYGACSNGDLDNVANLNLIGCLGLSAVYDHSLSVAGLVGHCAALDEAGHLEIFIKPHFSSIKPMEAAYAASTLLLLLILQLRP